VKVRTFVAALVCAAAGGGQLAAAAAPQRQDRDPVFSPDGRTLAFVRSTGSTGRVEVVATSGRGHRALTPPQPAPYGITWSPDGSALAYSSGGAIWRVDADGAGLRRLTDTATANRQPAWSPEGGLIAFTATEGCGYRCYRVFAIAPDGTGQRQLAVSARRASWSPDGTRFADSNGDVRAASDGSVLRRIEARGSMFTWGNSGSIAYVSGSTLGIASANGPGTRVLVNTRRDPVNQPAWSHDVQRIAFAVGRWLAVTNMSGVWHRVAPADLADDAPSWAPNGTIAYVERGRCGIDLILADRSHHRRLTHGC